MTKRAEELVEEYKLDEKTTEELDQLLDEIAQNIQTEEDPEATEEEQAEAAVELPKEIEDLQAMVEAITELKANKRSKLAQRSALMNRIEEGRAKVVRSAPEIKEEKKTMSEVEIRSGAEYGKAYLHYLKTGEDKQCRALLSTNGTNQSLSLTGYVPVPTFLETEIKNAWEECKLVALAKHTEYKGNVKVGFEKSATGAAVHIEGDEEPDEEVITIGVVDIIAQNIKKWITVSDEAIEGTTVDTMGYLFKEIAQRIAEAAEGVLVGLITAAPTTSTGSAVAVAEMACDEIAIDTIVKAEALLGGKARDLHIAMNRQTYAQFVAAGMAANYAVDVFDGLKDRVVITDALETFDASGTDGDCFAIIGDFGYGAQANFPNGQNMMIKTDDLSLAEKDLVKIVGRQYVGMALVAEKAFVRLVIDNP